MAPKREHPLSFEEFRDLMARELQLNKEDLTEDASFYDLMVDSIRMVEMLLHLEEQGIAIPLELAWQIETVGDAYRLYQESVAASPGAAEAWTLGLNHAGEG
ncbi:MAG: acyl carrier protein [Anaerolineae bacterium]